MVILKCGVHPYLPFWMHEGKNRWNDRQIYKAKRTGREEEEGILITGICCSQKREKQKESKDGDKEDKTEYRRVRKLLK